MPELVPYPLGPVGWQGLPPGSLNLHEPDPEQFSPLFALVAMSTEILLSGLLAVAFASIHAFGGGLKFLRVTPRSIWLSAAGGVSVAYVFVHLLPELARHQETLTEAVAPGGGLAAATEQHSYLIALAGLASFYGLEHLARRSGRSSRETGGDGRTAAHIFWIHLGSFAVYNVLIGYLLLHREEGGSLGLLAYGFAMALHFLVNDQGLRDQHGGSYDRTGRWLLAAAPVAGWGLGLATTISAPMIAAMFAFLAGGVVLNVLKEELPEERESRFSAFAIGTAAYGALLVVTG